MMVLLPVVSATGHNWRRSYHYLEWWVVNRDLGDAQWDFSDRFDWAYARGHRKCHRVNGDKIRCKIFASEGSVDLGYSENSELADYSRPTGRRCYARFTEWVTNRRIRPHEWKVRWRYVPVKKRGC
jgi:hypothetical protein